MQNIMEGLKSDLEEATARLARVERQNKSLAQRNELLEKVVSLNCKDTDAQVRKHRSQKPEALLLGRAFVRRRSKNMLR